jgi:site-specific DNA-cytosine methylase
MSVREIRHFHPCGGLGGGARGFNAARVKVGLLHAKFRCIGGFDNNPAACRDFARLAGAPLAQLDIFTLEQYMAYHGHPPKPGWREATVTDIHRAAGNERPHIIFASMPCKGFSGLLSEAKSLSPKYQALNALALRGIALCLEAWQDDPAEFVLFENVPRIQSRGEQFIDQIQRLLALHGYESAPTTHDCGELGELSQSRRRFLLVARHVAKVPPFLYEPVKRPLRPVSAVLKRCPLPGDLSAGPMHRVPALNWQTWVRLAFVEAGKDWRSLQRLQIHDGMLRDYAIAPHAHYHAGVYGVQSWDDTSCTIAARTGPTNGAFTIADPRICGHEQSVQLGVRRWDQPGPTVTGQMWPGQGPFTIADPRPTREQAFRNVYRVVRWDEVGRAVTAGGHPSAGGVGVADPRVGYGPDSHRNKLLVQHWNAPSRTITCATQVQGGALSVADPRSGLDREKGDHYLTAGHYGIVPWNSHAYAITGHGQHDNGFHSVADPRLSHGSPDSPARRTDSCATQSLGSPQSIQVPDVRVLGGGLGASEPHQRRQAAKSLETSRHVGAPDLPKPTDRLVAVIRAPDGTWHRPFTTFELAALQSLVDPEEQLELDGLSDSAWRERIGNAVPSNAAKAIAEVVGTTLLLAWSGETFVLGSTPIWVRNIAVALSVSHRLPT